MDDIGELTELVNRLLAQFDSIVERISAAAAETGESAAAIAAVLVDSEKTVEGSSASFAALQHDLEAQAKEAESLKAVLVSFSTATRGVGEAAESQRRYVTDSSSAMEEMASSIESVERMTDSAGGLTVRLADRGVDGGKAVDDTAAAIAEIRVASESVLEVLGSLNRIAASTNLLAMNASIEAAHAGDRGAGFAVVAEEVRNLAAEAAAQNRRIRDLVGAMRERVARGVSAAEASGTVLKDLVGGLKQAAAISTEISAAMKEQAAGTRSAADSLQMIVKASADIGGRVTEQDERSEEMAQALGETIERLSALVAESRRQAESVTALRESFAAVRAQVERNTSAADGLEAEIRRFRA
jgi:methyl-accepting chemotaxis protein